MFPLRFAAIAVMGFLLLSENAVSLAQLSRAGRVARISQGEFERARRGKRAATDFPNPQANKDNPIILLVGSTEGSRFVYELVLRPARPSWVKGVFLDARGKPVGRPSFWKVRLPEAGTEKPSADLPLGSAPSGSTSFAVAIAAEGGLYHRVLSLVRDE